MRSFAVALAMAAIVGLASAQGPTTAATGDVDAGRDPVLLVNLADPAYPKASEVRGQQVLMLLRHFEPGAVLVEEADYRSGMVATFDRVVVLGNAASHPVDPRVLADLHRRRGPTMWIGYGLSAFTPDPDRDLGFAPGFVSAPGAPVSVTYQGRTYPTSLEDLHLIRVALPDVKVMASVRTADQSVPLAVRHGDFWFFGTLPGIETDYPDPAVDAPTLIFADLLHEFFGRAEHDAPQAIIRLEDVSVHVEPSRIIDAVDALASRNVPFVIGVIPAQRLADGSVLSLRDRPDFVQALRYAQDRGGTIALHGYHHTYGQGEDFEFWDAARDAPPEGERRETYALKVEDGIRALRDEGLEPLLWETPHYAASDVGYAVFANYFSHAIEDRDPVTWLPYPSGPDPAGQILIPENLGYINEADGRTVEAQLARAGLLRIVRDATAVGFYHPAAIPIADLLRLVEGLAAQGYRFADVRGLPLRVDRTYRPDTPAVVAASIRIEPGLALLELQRGLLGLIPTTGALDTTATAGALSVLAVAVFLVRLRAQWRPRGAARSRVEHEGARAPGRSTARLLLAGAVAILLAGTARQTFLGPVAPTPIERIRTAVVVSAPVAANESDGWAISAYFTAVERYYSGPRVLLLGCPVIDCANGTQRLGWYAQDFLDAVKAEGSGRLTRPVDGSAYLDWSIDTGYWLDSAPRDARGSVLQPYVSAAADPAIAYVSTIRIDHCGVDARTGEPTEPAACDAIRGATWIVRDRFTVGSVGKHLDLYIGEQDAADFLRVSPRAIDTRDARVSIRPYDTDRWGT